MNVCAFCGPTTAPMSDEDLYPAWLTRLYQRHFNFRQFGLISTDTRGVVTEGPTTQRINIRIPVVCRPCNNGWMSQIETLAQPVLTPLITTPYLPRTLSEDDCV